MMPHCIKVVFFIGYAVESNGFRGTNGPEIRFREMCKSLPPSIFPIVVYPEFATLCEDFKELEKKRKIKLMTYNPSGRIDYVTFLYKVLSENKVDVIHCQGPHLFDAITVVLGKYFNVQTIVTRPVIISEDHLSKIKKIIFLMLDHLIIKRANQLVTISKKHKKQWLDELGWKPYSNNRDIKVVYNGIDLNRFNQNTSKYVDNILMFAIIAQLTPVKGHKLLLNAVQKLNNEGYKFQLNIVGDGPLRKDLESIVKSKGLGDIVIFNGKVKSVEKILRDIHVVILPSYREGLSVALLEAMAMHCALIATDVGASSELILDGVNGYLVPKGDSDEIYKKMKLMLDNLSRVALMGKNSYELSSKYDLLKMTAEYQEIYTELSKGN